MGTTYLKSIKIIITFEDGNVEKVPFIVPIKDTPFYEVKITWEDNKRINSGEVKGIVIYDGKDKFNCISDQKFALTDGQELILEFPNKDFHLNSIQTNVIGVSFCVDNLPINWQELVTKIFEDAGLHHPVVLFRRDGYYRRNSNERP